MISLDSDVTVNGRPVTEARTAAWAAEEGFDVAALKKRGRGRPGRGVVPLQVVTLRLTPEEVAELNARATRHGKSRADVIREALADTAA